MEIKKGDLLKTTMRGYSDLIVISLHHIPNDILYKCKLMNNGEIMEQTHIYTSAILESRDYKTIQKIRREKLNKIL